MTDGNRQFGGSGAVETTSICLFYAKRRYFKISLHKSGDWRMAFTSEYAKVLRRLGTWKSDRCFEQIRRPVLGHAQGGFWRGVRIYFPESELRSFTEFCEEPVQDVPACSRGGVRVADLIITNEKSRFSKWDWPLLGSLHAEKIANWKLPNGEMVWIVHFCWSATAESLEKEADWFRSNMNRAQKLDTGSTIDSASQCARIMIAGVNGDHWFAVIDSAMNPK